MICSWCYVIVTNDNNSPFISAPCIKGTSERVARILKQYNVKLAYKPTRTLKHEHCHLKDKRLTQDAAGVIVIVRAMTITPACPSS